MKNAVFGIARSEPHAEEVLQKLQNVGFYAENMSALFQESTRYNKENLRADEEHKAAYKGGAMGHEKHTKAPEGGASGAAIGGLIGGTLGLLAGIGSLAIPGLGALVAAGPILAALSGTAVGGSLGLLTGFLIGLGIPEYEAKRYEHRVKSGGVLLSVHAETAEEVEKIKDIFVKNGIEDIATSKEKAVLHK